MRACVRPNDGVYSEWFKVEQWLWPGCVLSSLLYNTFFAAVLFVVLQSFNQDTVFLAELVHLKKPPMPMESEPAIDYVRRVVWGMMYADNASDIFTIAVEVR